MRCLRAKISTQMRQSWPMLICCRAIRLSKVGNICKQNSPFQVKMSCLKEMELISREDWEVCSRVLCRWSWVLKVCSNRKAYYRLELKLVMEEEVRIQLNTSEETATKRIRHQIRTSWFWTKRKRFPYKWNKIIIRTSDRLSKCLRTWSKSRSLATHLLPFRSSTRSSRPYRLRISRIIWIISNRTTKMVTTFKNPPLNIHLPTSLTLLRKSIKTRQCWMV